MPQALPVPVRQAVLRRWQHGQTAVEIAAALALRARTIRHLIRTFRHAAANDLQTLAPAYPHCSWRRSWNNQLLRHDALQMRRQHPGWGAGLIRVFLGQRWRRQPLPSVRTLQRWFQREGLGPAPRGRRPRGLRARAQRPHEVWQMDAVEQIRLQNKQLACWLRITDEFSGAVLHTKVMPVGRWSSVGAPAVQAELRKAFARWGRPERLRVDNGTPWGATGGLPTPLALWVMGLEVVLTWNHPCRPRENAVVERTQGVSEGWVEPHTCANAQQLQRRLDEMDQIHRESYPSIAGRSRMQAYPRLAHSGRYYSREWERRHWSLQRVLDSLAEYAVARRVDTAGNVWLYDRGHYVGKARHGQQVYATLDADTREWVFQDARAGEIRRQPAAELTQAKILQMETGRPGRCRPATGKTHGGIRGKTMCRI